MAVSPEITNESEIDRLADESSCAISVIDSQRHEIHISNNNSICKELNPGPGFSPDCDKYCGAVFARAASSPEKIIRYRCHAGLDCRAVAYRTGESPLVAIIGRTFTDADKYREATERAISGDWSQYPPNDFFANVLMSGSSIHLDHTAEAVRKHVLQDRGLMPSPPALDSEGETILLDLQKKGPESVAPRPQAASPQTKRDDKRVPAIGVSEWRSLFGSLLTLDYFGAAEATLEFVSKQFGLTSLLWLKRNGSRLENSFAFGKMKDRRVRVGLSAGDERLLQALAEGKPLEINERRKGANDDQVRKMSLFPIGLAGEISAAIAVLEPIDDEAKRDHIVRICRSVAQQFEILRLRNEVVRGDQISAAVRKFSESLKRSDHEDLWMSLTQDAAEMLRAERSSLLVFDEGTQKFQIKAILGATHTFRDDPAIGERVAKFVFDTKRAIAVEDISKAGVLPDATDRSYKTPSFLSTPISVGGRVIGVMNFADRASGESFDKASLELFDAIAPQLAMAMDRAELKERAGQFEQLSVTDALTGLLNRRYMQERLLEETKRSNRHGYPMSFMMIDVDEFKSYNDNYGHPAGDEALKLVGNVIRETLRSADVAARFGGEEFAILLPQTTSNEARMIADRIRTNIENTKFPHRTVTISIGVSSCSAELCQDADLVSAADKALYRAKRSGRNRVLAFEDELDKVPG
jgi:diguanylate cyclase (GGDEF)-like protein